MSNEAPNAGAANTAANIPAPTAPAAPTAEEVLAKREKAIRMQMQKFQTEKQKWESERKKYETDYVPKAELKDKWLDMLTEQGLTQEQIAQHLLNTPSDPNTKAIMAKIKQLEESQANSVKAQEQAQIEQAEAAKVQMSQDIKGLIDTDTQYETLKATPGADQAVLDMIIEDFEKTGVLKDIDKACAEYEEFLVEEYYQKSQLPKVQAKSKPKQEETAASTTEAQKPKWTGSNSAVKVTPQVRTLSNNMQTQPAGKTSEKQRIERALAAFHGKPTT